MRLLEPLMVYIQQLWELLKNPWKINLSISNVWKKPLLWSSYRTRNVSKNFKFQNFRDAPSTSTGWPQNRLIWEQPGNFKVTGKILKSLFSSFPLFLYRIRLSETYGNFQKMQRLTKLREPLGVSENLWAVIRVYSRSENLWAFLGSSENHRQNLSACE